MARNGRAGADYTKKRQSIGDNHEYGEHPGSPPRQEPGTETTQHHRVGRGPGDVRTHLRRLRPRGLWRLRVHLPAGRQPSRHRHPRHRRRPGQLRPLRRAGRGPPRRLGRRHPRPPQGAAVLLCLVLHRHGHHRPDEFGGHLRRDALHHRPGRGRAARHHRRPGLGIRAEGQEEPAQRDCLLRDHGRQPAGGPTCHPAARAHRLARAVLDRRAAAHHPAAARLLQDAGVGAVAGQPWPSRRSPGRGRAHRLPDARPQGPGGGELGRREDRGLCRAVQVLPPCRR